MGRKRDLTSKAASRVAKPVSVLMPKRKERCRQAPRLAVVMFHHIALEPVVDGPSRDVVMTVENFRKYCEILQHNFLICTFHEAMELLGQPSEKPLMVFSFDDGYADFYENAFPILKELGIKSNQNIIVGYADEPREGYLNWEQIGKLSQSGMVEFGCHTYNKHYFAKNGPVLETLGAEETLADLQMAKQSFLEHLDFAPDILAWPYGVKPRKVADRDLAALGIKFQLNTISGINFNPIDWTRIKRFVALDYESPEKLLAIIKGYSDLGFLMNK